LRHLLAILLLPFLAVVGVPYWLFTTFGAADTRWSEGVQFLWLPRLASLAFISAGFLLFSWCVILFARIGRGTLAPWDPARSLVAVGPYRHARNPMISGAALVLIGLAIFWGSRILGLWAGIFILINHLYFILSEEPGLEHRFGEHYRRYKANVPRWIPRIGPWKGS
jgi:protein-S-isoprenylcysteine O-methyltransferase Ste14